MNNGIEEYVHTLDDAEKILIINGWEHLQKTGSIGDEPLRIHAHTLLTKLGFSDTDAHIVMWMSQIAMECYRYFAWKEIRMRGLLQAEMDYYLNKKETLTPIPPGYTLDQTPKA